MKAPRSSLMVWSFDRGNLSNAAFTDGLTLSRIFKGEKLIDGLGSIEDSFIFKDVNSSVKTECRTI